MDIKELILRDREQRMNLIKDVIVEHNLFVIIIKCNVCGDQKNFACFEFLKKYFLNQILNTFTIHSYDYYESYDGNYFLVQIEDDSEISVKKKLVDLENGVFGRVIDLDLYTNLEKSVSRNDLSIKPRRCIVCGNSTISCMRNSVHTVDEVLMHTQDLIQKDLIKNLAEIVKDSMYEEVSAEPKFGLVTKNTNGKHQDMSYDTFTASIEAINKYVEEYARVGFDINDDSFTILREIGKRAEVAMYEATGNINTHKGTIFILGFLVPSIVDALYNNKPFIEVSNTIKYLAKDIMLDFNMKSAITAGEKAFIKYDITGVRGEVFSGLEKVFEAVEKFIDYDTDNNSLVIDLLLNFMSCVDDTVILSRREVGFLDYVKGVAQEIIEQGGYRSDVGKNLVDEYTTDFIYQNISPGGSADMTIASLILLKIVSNFY
ncbi:MAG: triphosphoribosyl-dephospho-CoA synthase [Bacilli bacterium]